MMRTREKHTPEPGLRQISPVRAWLLKIWGPAESWDNPLVGTRYDPIVKQHHDQIRRAEHQARRAQQRRARAERRRSRAYEASEHYTPDE
jgi:hypothetical protein